MDYEAMAVELLKIQAKANRLRASQQMDGYTQGEIFVLGYLYESGKKVWPKDISRAMAVSSARVSVLLNHMEQKGWIRRLSDDRDNRKTIVSLTELGEDEFMIRQKEVLGSVSAMLRELGEEDAETYLRIRRKMVQEPEMMGE